MRKNSEIFIGSDNFSLYPQLPPGFGQPEFEANYARAQTWVVFGLAGARKPVLTKVLYGFEPQVVKIIEWMMDQIDVDAGQRSANDN